MKNILVLVDDPKNASSTVHFALQIAIKTKANLLLGHAIKQSLIKEDIDEQKNYWMEFTEHLKKSLPFRKDISESPLISCIVEQATVTEFSLKMVAQEKVDLIVTGPQKSSGLEHFLFGTVIDGILDKANCPVLVVPDRISFKAFERVTFAADLSFQYQNALRYIASLAMSFNAKVTVNNVSKLSFPKKIAERDISKEVNEKLGEGFPDVDYHTLKGKGIKTTLNTMLKENDVDLLCLVHRQYDLLHGLFHTSVSKEMVRTVNLPILILPFTAIPDEKQLTETELEQFCFNTADELSRYSP